MQTRLGTMDPLVNVKELPRPLDGEVKLKYLEQLYVHLLNLLVVLLGLAASYA
jgi:hypothetical protein